MSLTPSSKLVIAGVGISVVAAIFIHLRASQYKKAAKMEHGEDGATDHTSPELKVIDISSFVANRRSSAECEQVARALREYGIVIVRDQRVSVTDNDDFIDMMER